MRVLSLLPLISRSSPKQLGMVAPELLHQTMSPLKLHSPLLHPPLFLLLDGLGRPGPRRQSP